MDTYKREAIEEFKNRVKYIGIFHNMFLDEKAVLEESSSSKIEKKDRKMLLHIEDYHDVGEKLFDDIMKLPDLLNWVVSGTNEEKSILTINAFLQTGDLMPIQYFRDRAAGQIPPMTVERYSDFSDHDQNTPFHCYDLRMHTIKVVEYVQKNFDSFNIDPDIQIPLVIAAQWHDIGKLYTKIINKDGFNEYPGHPMSSAEEFDKEYNGKNKELISFFIRNHDRFLFYKKPDLTDEVIESLRKKIQDETPFKINSDHWRALTMLMEADESAKNPVVVIKGKVVRTMEEDFEKVRYIRAKLEQKYTV